MGLARKAILYTLLIHVVVLGAMVWVPVSDEIPPVRPTPKCPWSTQKKGR